MAKIEWTQDLSVGINLIDEQHQLLFQRLNDLANAIDMSQGEKTIVSTLDFLVDYTNFHFATEEKNMSRLYYPGLEYHQTQHKEFIMTLSHLVDDFKEEGATRALSTSINDFLNNWLIHHIKTIDVQFGKCLMDKGFKDIEE